MSKKRHAAFLKRSRCVLRLRRSKLHILRGVGASFISFTASEQASYPSLPAKAESEVITLLLLSRTNPLRWALRGDLWKPKAKYYAAPPFPHKPAALGFVRGPSLRSHTIGPQSVIPDDEALRKRAGGTFSAQAAAAVPRGGHLVSPEKTIVFFAVCAPRTLRDFFDMLREAREDFSDNV